MIREYEYSKMQPHSASCLYWAGSSEKEKKKKKDNYFSLISELLVV